MTHQNTFTDALLLAAQPLEAATHLNTFTDALLLAAQALEADEGPADEAQGGVLWHLLAGGAGLPVVVLEDGVVVVRELQEMGGCPLRVLD